MSSSFRIAKDLTPKEAQALTEMKAGMLWNQPFFAHLLLDQCTLEPSRDVPIAATDGRHIFVNPAKFVDFSVGQRMYVLAHEIMHNVWGHMEQLYQANARGGLMTPSGWLPFDNGIAQMSLDLSINTFLDECRIGERPPEGHYDVAGRYKGGESWIGIYAEEYAKAKNNPGNNGGGSGGSGNPGGFDQHMDPGQGTPPDQPQLTPAQAIADKQTRQAEMDQAVVQAATVAKARGTVPAAIERLLGELIHPKVDWKDILTGMVVKNIGGGSHTWKMPDMGMFIFKDSPYMPSRTGLGVGTAVLARDTSGSIDQRTIELMGGCMAGIFEQAPPERAIVIDCDAQVQQIIELDKPTDIDAAEVSRRAVGGGGTMFEPVFAKLDELDIKPDVLVYLTDGYGSYPAQPPGYQVIWAIVPGGRNSCPWGDTVIIEE